MNEKDLVFVYRYDNDSGDLFGVMEEMVGYDYELASIDELDREEEWAKFVIVKEGAYRWDVAKKDYVKI